MNVQSLAADTALAVGSYYLGASSLIPEVVHRLRIRARKTLVRWMLTPAWHPARWTYETLRYALAAWDLALAFTFHPRTATTRLRQKLPLLSFRQPAELKEAVAEAARLHVPGKPATTVRFAVYQGRCDLSNVTVRHGRAPEAVTHITLGGNPDDFGGLKPGQGTRAELHASRDRVEAALRALPIGPDIRVLTVRVDHQASQ